jgi:Tfp pilus assembly protein PilP
LKRVWLISDLRLCRKCEEEKPINQFTKGAQHKGGHRNECKNCTAEYSRKRRENPEIAQKSRESAARWVESNPEANKQRYLLRKFNITLEEYQDLLLKQDGVCAICREPESVVRRSKTGKEMLAVDHCHETGKVRGLLCFKCNTALGALGDSIEGLERALAYLKEKSNA